jgi:hypothetical protein
MAAFVRRLEDLEVKVVFVSAQEKVDCNHRRTFSLKLGIFLVFSLKATRIRQIQSFFCEAAEALCEILS